MRKKGNLATLITTGLGILAVVFLYVFIQQTAFAQTSFSIEDIGSSIGLGTSDLKETVLNIIRWLLGILALVAVSFVIYGGILYVTSRGNEQQIEKAKRTIVNALIGLVIVILAWAIVLFVARFITGGIGGDGETCTDGDTRSFGCEICSSGTWVNNPAPPDPDLCVGLGFPQFRLDSVSTSFALPGDNATNVTLCSNVLLDFNNYVKQASVDAAIADDAPVPLVIVNTDVGNVEFEGTWQTLKDTVTFRHNKFCTGTATACTDDSVCSAALGETCDVITFLPDTNYELRVPKGGTGIKDTSDDPLAICNALPGCTDEGSYFAWRFSTGTETDVTTPQVTTTYPIRAGPTYPDTNVDRQPLIDVKFSEAIDPASVISVSSGLLNENNVYIERIDGAGGSPVLAVSETDADADGKVDADKWNVNFGSNSFRLDLVAPLALEPFTWYRITVQNIEDLCGNGLSDQVVWEFQTNDSIATIKSVYPEGSNQCPDSRIAATFGTTMFRHDVQFIVSGAISIDLTLPAPEISGVTQVSSGGHVLKILDPVPGGYKQYELTPGTPLPVNSSFTVQIVTNRVIDESGTTLGRTWSFATSTPDTCTCAPHISGISPNQGGPGQCTTVQGYCFTGTDANPATLSSLTIGGTNATVLGAPTKTRIITTVPNSLGLGNHAVQATIDYGAPFGSLSSNTDVQFNLSTTDASEGPCLIDLNPDQGYPLTPVTATGERFGTTPGAVTFNALNASINTWADAEVKTSVPPPATDGPVCVWNSDGESSNCIFFDVLQPPPGEVSVIDAKPTCGSACINTLLLARFNKEIDPATLTSANVRVRRCQSDTCEWNLLDPALGTINVDPAGYDSVTDTFTFSNTVNFVPNTRYRVLLSGGAGGITSVTDEELRVNFDENDDGTDDAYSWTFKTKDDPTACAMNSAKLIPQVAFLGTIGATRNYTSQALASPDACDPAGQIINVGDVWAWTIQTAAAPAEAEFVPDAKVNDNLAGVLAKAETVVDPPPDFVTVEACANSFCDAGELTIDVSWCDETTVCDDLDPDAPGIECPGSTCDLVKNRCTPVVNSMTPVIGGIGTWTTLSGCYFDGYDAVKSKVVFKDEKPGLCLPTATCGSCASQWSNSEATVELPDDSTPDASDDAVTGPVRIQTKHDFTANAPSDFTVGGPVPPGLCKVVPASGEAGVTNVALHGAGFGATQDSGNVTFATNQIAPVTSWSNELVNVVVPTFAETGLVTLTQSSLTSNGKTFTVVPGACAVEDQCASDADCDVGEGCGAGSCCSARPNVLSTNPADGATNVCRNAGILITFDRPMDQSSLAIVSNYEVLPGSFTIASVTSTSVILNPGLMVSTTPYTVKVFGTVRSATGVTMGTDKSFAFTTGTDICAMDHIDVLPALSTFVASGQSQTLDAYVYDVTDTLLLEQPGTYEWTWAWTTSKPLTAAFSVPPGDAPSQTLITQSKNGDATITARATAVAPNTGSAAGTAIIRLNIPGVPGDTCGSFNSCVIDADCGVATQGCSDGNCCGLRPAVVSTNPVNGATNVCRNAAVEITFSGPMDGAMRNDEGNYQFTSGGSPISFNAIAVGSDRALLMPLDQLPIGSITVRVLGGLKNTEGISIGSDYQFQFTTASTICELGSVDVTPVLASYNASGIDFPIGAVAYGTNGNPIADLPGIYSYAWSWANSNINVAFFQPANPGDSQSGDMRTGTVSGETIFTGKATVDAPGTGSKQDSGKVRLTLTGSPADACIAAGLDACADDSDCSGGQACGSSSCCVDRPDVASTNPADDAVNVCLNAGISITFDRDMDVTSLKDPANYDVNPDGFSVVSATKRTVYLKPDPFPLSPTAAYTVTVQSTVRSAEGVTMALDRIFNFTTGSSICNLSSVSIMPKLWVSYKSNVLNTFQADTFAENGDLILEAPGLYSWAWEWTSSNIGVADYTSPAPHDNPSQEVRTGTTSGKSVLRATATVDSPGTGSASGTAEVQLIVCENPWGLPALYGTDGIFIDSAVNCTPGLPCTDFDFTLAYCRGGNPASLLPDFTQINIKGIAGDVQKQYLFKSPNDDDAIGVRIIANPDLLSPEVWYQQQFPFDTGAPQSMVVDGYPAVRDGRTIYVAATRFTGSALQSYIYLLSYNQNAKGSTISIYNQMLQAWRFNVGFNNPPFPGLEPDDKLAVSHDMRRIADLSKIASELDEYENDNGTYPPLAAGSFIAGMSTSTWSTSWNATLGNALRKTLPVDPLNTFSSCPPVSAGYEQRSCWNDTTKTFKCEPGSHIYLYKTNAGDDYTLYANMEYTGPGKFGTGAGDPCSGAPGGSTCACFNYTRSSP